jgi:hypothetical protein
VDDYDGRGRLVAGRETSVQPQACPFDAAIFDIPEPAEATGRGAKAI